jgi:sugar O-acyltransferase (sialic acid O-acetyltransferase NeuD family)
MTFNAGHEYHISVASWGRSPYNRCSDLIPPSHALVLFGVGSPIVVDVEESARRAQIEIVAAVQNVPGEPAVLDRTRLVLNTAVPVEVLELPFLVPLFNPQNRQRASAEAFRAGFTRAFNLIDPTAVVPSSWTLGCGIYINSGCTVGAAVMLDDFVFVNRGASLGHHVQLGRFVSIGPGAVLAGQVKVGAGSLIGAGAVIVPGITIGENALVGAGAVVTRDVPPQALVAPHPTRLVNNLRGVPR